MSTPARRRLVATGLLAAVVAAGLAVYRPSPLRDLDARVYDVLLRSAHRPETSGLVVIVDLDEQSLAQYGRWPWPRSRLAQLLTRIHALGAAGVGLDMMFPEPDETGAPAGGPGSPPTPAAALTPNDAALADVLGQGPFVLGYELTFGAAPQGRGDCLLHPLRVVVQEDAPGSVGAPGLVDAGAAICSLPGLARAAAASGFLNAMPDADGTLRRLPLVIGYGGAIYPSLALATLMRAIATRQVVLRAVDGAVASLRLDDVVIPLDPRGNLLLRFRGAKRRFRYVSAADVLADRVPAGSISGKIVFVGTSALGLRETVVTPVDTWFPGVELHATVVDNVLRQDFVRRPGTAPALELGLTLAAGVAAALAVVWVGVPWGGSLLAVAGGGLWVGAGWLLGARGVFVSPLFPSLALAGCFGALTLASLLLERRRADRTTHDFEQARELMLHTLTSLTETRDNETGAHLLRTRRYMQRLGESLASHPRFRGILTPETIDLLARLAPIHDIGKVGVPDQTLRKPGPFTTEERDEMNRHPAYGRDVIANAEQRVGIEDDVFLRMAKEIVYTHHERWDGAGYPEGLRGDAIPIAGRLVAIVDVYDALASKRVYKERMSHEDVVLAIAAGRGTQFDPDVVDAFLRIEAEWHQIALQFADDGPAAHTPDAPRSLTRE